MTPSSSCGGYKELHAGQHAYVMVFGTPSIFRATLISVGKFWRNSSSVGDKLLLIVFLKSSFSDLSLKLLEFRVEWSRLSWTSTWNKVRCKNELHSSKERIKSLSFVKISTCCMLTAEILTRFSSTNCSARCDGPGGGGEYLLHIVNLLDTLS
jgi:hypothetical protein